MAGLVTFLHILIEIRDDVWGILPQNWHDNGNSIMNVLICTAFPIEKYGFSNLMLFVLGNHPFHVFWTLVLPGSPCCSCSTFGGTGVPEVKTLGTRFVSCQQRRFFETWQLEVASLRFKKGYPPTENHHISKGDTSSNGCFFRCHVSFRGSIWIKM